MRALVIVLVLIAVGVVGLGFYRGWFAFAADTTDHKSNVTFSVDKDKVKEDKDAAKEKLQDFGQNVKDKTGGQTNTVKEPATAKEPERQP